jgi:hypothetical protein
MFCILLSGPVFGDGLKWRGRRSAELISYHFDLLEARIVVGIYVQNERDDGEPNTLWIMHPGNVELRPHRGNLKFRHPDEPVGESCLFRYYGAAFETTPGGVMRQVRALVSWDEWVKTKSPEAVHLWPDEDNPEDCCQQLTPVVSSSEHVPFTAWALSGFSKRGPYLVYFEIRLGEPSFSRFVQDPAFFTVDGPASLLARIEHSEIPSIAPGKQDQWLSLLMPFRHFVSLGDGYDVLLMGAPYGDNVEVRDAVEISAAPEQQCGYVARFVTRSPWFNLALRRVDVPMRIEETPTNGVAGLSR